MTIDLKDVTAVSHDDVKGVIGYLTWSSIGEQLITLDALEKLFEANNLDKGFLPKRVREPDAFRRATAIKATRKTSQAGIIEHYITRDVTRSKDSVIRHIVCETVDKFGQRLSYEEDAAVLIFERESGQMKWYASNSYAKTLADQAAANFELYKKNISGSMLRFISARVLQSLAPTPVRPSGGVYFVPIQNGERLKNLNGFISTLNPGEAFYVPLLNNKENTEMVRLKLDEHMTEALSLCEKTINGELKDHQIRQALENAKQVVNDFKQYTSLIGSDMATFEEKISLLRGNVMEITKNFGSNKNRSK